jgi:hypothetical protein
MTAEKRDDDRGIRPTYKAKAEVPGDKLGLTITVTGDSPEVIGIAERLANAFSRSSQPEGDEDKSQKI